MLHRGDERLELLLLGGNAAGAQVGVPGDRPGGEAGRGAGHIEASDRSDTGEMGLRTGQVRSMYG